MSKTIKKEQLFPINIIKSEGMRNAESLLRTRATQVIMIEDEVACLNCGGYVILDFGKEIYGAVRILFKSVAEEATVHVRLGESVAEACVALGENGACNAHSVRDCRYPASQWTDLRSCDTGFRFVRIDLETGDFSEIKSVFAEAELCHYERRGYFKSSDETLNRIAETAAYTAELCIRNDYVWDGIKRDRTVWIGDLHPEMLTLIQLFGNIKEIENSLDSVKYFFPHAWVNKIPAYSAWWIICLADYANYGGSEEFVKDKLSLVKEILVDFERIVGKDGEISYSNNKLELWDGNEYFFDWQTNNAEDSKIGWLALVSVAFGRAKMLLKKYGEDCSLATELAERVSKTPAEKSDFKQVEALSFLSGRRSANQVKNALAKNGGEGMSGFLGYYILTAAAETGNEATVIKMIKEYYGGMIEKGATTLWEDFDVEWLKDNPQSLSDIPQNGVKNIHRDYGKFCYKGLRHSLCHGWTSGVYAFLIRTILGVKPAGEGFDKVEIKPNLLGLEYAEGKIPTPHGDIFVSHRNQNGKVVSEIVLPEGIERV